RNGFSGAPHAARATSRASAIGLITPGKPAKLEPARLRDWRLHRRITQPQRRFAMAVASPYHERRTSERRRIAYPGLFGAEGMRVSWGGIFGGVLVAVGLLLLLAALGVAVG